MSQLGANRRLRNRSRAFMPPGTVSPSSCARRRKRAVVIWSSRAHAQCREIQTGAESMSVAIATLRVYPAPRRLAAPANDCGQCDPDRLRAYRMALKEVIRL